MGPEWESTYSIKGDSSAYGSVDGLLVRQLKYLVVKSEYGPGCDALLS